MKIIEPTTTEELEQYYELRWKILRAPWNQVRDNEREDDDKSSTHLMVIDDNRPKGQIHSTISYIRVTDRN